MDRRTIAVLAVVAFVVLAGCGGPASEDGSDPRRDATTTWSSTTTDSTPTASTPTSTRSPTTTTTQEPDLVAQGFDPDYDPSVVLDRTERLRGLNATRPIFVSEKELPLEVRENETRDLGDSSWHLTETGAKALQLYSARPVVPTPSTGATGQGDSVIVTNGTALRVRYGISQEAILVHELVHILQEQHGLVDRGPSEPPGTTDGLWASAAFAEGDAVLVAQQYRERYLPEHREERFLSAPARNATGTRARWGLHLTNAVYYEGYRYFRRTGTDPAHRNAVLRDGPPDTMAEILHPRLESDLPGDPVRAPTVDGDRPRHRDRLGELTARYALRVNGVPYGVASEAVAGWRNDTFAYYGEKGTTAVYWGTRWVDASEAREFAAAWRRMLRGLNATKNGSVLTVPGSEYRPTVHYVVERDGAVVHVAAASNASTARRIAAAFPDEA